MSAEQYWPATITTLAGAWTCQKCGGTFVGYHTHDEQPVCHVMADPMALGRIATSLERIAAALERREVRDR